MKKSQMLRIILILLFSAAVNTASANAHWPTWRGPDTMGIAPEGNPPTTWSETQNIKWKVKLTGDGSNSSPIVWGDKIFFQTAVDTGIKDTSSVAAPAPPRTEFAQARREGDRRRRTGFGRGRGRGRGGFGSKPPTTQFKFNLVCMDRGTGKVLWEKTVCQLKPHQGHHRHHGYASFSPVTDGQYVWANFGSRGIYCYDMEGNQIWSKELPQMSTMFGEGTSPSLAGDALIVVADHRGDSSIFAFDKKTGNLLWKEARDEST
ncbi:MAG: PQQ-binding-like beta-propeller repeat protein, partial [Planctomycetes bacterium]|nr:PQQ-binding-like beta-propeller repeat protein [Planctomycetota bacterium]